MIVLITQSGVVSPTMPVSSMTHTSVPALVVSPLLSLPIHLYCLPLPSPCTLGQQVNIYYLHLIPHCLDSLLFGIASLYAIVWAFYCLAVLIVLPLSIVITYTYY